MTLNKTLKNETDKYKENIFCRICVSLQMEESGEISLGNLSKRMTIGIDYLENIISSNQDFFDCFVSKEEYDNNNYKKAEVSILLKKEMKKAALNRVIKQLL